jgi:hypothetical protein
MVIQKTDPHLYLREIKKISTEPVLRDGGDDSHQRDLGLQIRVGKNIKVS